MNISKKKLFHTNNQPVEWLIAEQPIDYEEAVKFMKQRVDLIIAGKARELIWLVEHPPLYSAGTSAKPDGLLSPDKFPIYKSGRGGQYTYHGPGQRVIYVMLDLKKRKKDVRAFVKALEAWIIDTLNEYNIKGELREDRIGVWVKQPEKANGAEGKIAAIGVRLSRWVSFHGISINVCPDLTHYEGIVPCGINDYGVTSFEDLGHLVPMSDVDMTLEKTFIDRFGRTYRSIKSEK